MCVLAPVKVNDRYNNFLRLFSKLYLYAKVTRSKKNNVKFSDFDLNNALKYSKNLLCKGKVKYEGR